MYREYNSSAGKSKKSPKLQHDYAAGRGSPAHRPSTTRPFRASVYAGWERCMIQTSTADRAYT